MAGAHLWLLKKWFCVLVVLSACCAVSVPRNDDAMVTCDTTSSALGETGQVTCHFPADVSSLLPAAITIEKYSNTDQKAESVLDCKWYEGGDIQCDTKEGYELHGPVERQLYLNITVMAHAHAGRYKCKMMTPRLVTDDDHVCDLKMLPAKKPVPTEEATTTDSSTGSGLTNENEQQVAEASSMIGLQVGVPVGAGLVIITIVVVVVVLITRRKKNAKRSDDPENQDNKAHTGSASEEKEGLLSPASNGGEKVAGLTENQGPPKPPRTMEATKPTTEQNDVGNDVSDRNIDNDARKDKTLPDIKNPNDVDAGDDDDDDDVFSAKAKGAGARRKGSNWTEELLEAATDIDGRARKRIMSDEYPYMADDMRAAAREKEPQETYGTATEEKSPTDRQGFDPSNNPTNFSYLT